MSRWSRPVVMKGTPPIGEIEARCSGCRRRFVAGEQYVSRSVPPFGQHVYAHRACAERLDGKLPADRAPEENPNP